MSVISYRPSLAEHLSGQHLKGLIKKKPFGGYEVPVRKFLEVGNWLFGVGAVFGRACRDKLGVVAKMFVGLDAIGELFVRVGLPRQQASSDQWVLEFLRKVASDGVRYYRDCHGKEPESLTDLWLTSFSPREFDFRDLNIARKLANRNIRLGIALQQLDSWLFVGISLGASLPDLTERMWQQSYETVNQDSWSLAYRAGVNIPKEFTPLPLQEAEQEVLLEVTSYATTHFPDCVGFR
jgi:hypothetical protein